MTPSDAYNIGVELVRPLSSDTSLTSTLGQVLANEQLDWRNGRERAVSESKFLKALNHHFGLENAPEYLQLGADEFRRVRVNVWIQLPDLSTGTDRKRLRKGDQIFGPTLSPFEAYLVSGLLIYQKLYNDDYVRTAAEEKLVANSGQQTLKPGLHTAPPNVRRVEFSTRLNKATTRLYSVNSAIKEVQDILEESRDGQ